jgi:hypothetical protein
MSRSHSSNLPKKITTIKIVKDDFAHIKSNLSIISYIRRQAVTENFDRLAGQTRDWEVTSPLQQLLNLNVEILQRFDLRNTTHRLIVPIVQIDLNV